MSWPRLQCVISTQWYTLGRGTTHNCQTSFWGKINLFQYVTCQLRNCQKVDPRFTSVMKVMYCLRIIGIIKTLTDWLTSTRIMRTPKKVRMYLYVFCDSCFIFSRTFRRQNWLIYCWVHPGGKAGGRASDLVNNLC